MLGICFGHQLIAHSLGGEVTKSDKAWGFGIRNFEVSKSTHWMTPKLEKECSLLFYHQDQVTKLPPRATHLASDDFCEFQMYSIDDHVFSIQGHTEFTREYSKLRIDNQKGNIPAALHKEAIDSLKNETNEFIVGQWINNFLKK